MIRFLWLVLTLLPILAALPKAAPAQGPSGLPDFAQADTISAIREQITARGYGFTVAPNWITALSPEERARLHSRRPSQAPRESVSGTTGALAPVLGTVVLPHAFDWRDVNGESLIGPIRNQGLCGACYAFAAAAAAEGTYNAAMRRAGNPADFSESYIAWCLGAYGPYSAHFGGCNGADYDYAELTALTVEGDTSEASFPYTGNDPGGCAGPTAPATVFSSWGRAGCGDIEAIKTAILTFGVVDAAVNVIPAFDAYSGGVYEDDQSGCPNTGYGGCAYTTTNHAISLVGWDDGNASVKGHWILRNSWGEDWGENGYMRIAYDAARVSCAVAYLVYEGAPVGSNVPPLVPLLLE